MNQKNLARNILIATWIPRSKIKTLFHYLTTISDILFTIGGKDNLELSCKYYCKAADLNPGNVRALFGIQLASSTLSSIGTFTLSAVVIFQYLYGIYHFSFVSFQLLSIICYEQVQCSSFHNCLIIFREVIQQSQVRQPVLSSLG